MPAELPAGFNLDIPKDGGMSTLPPGPLDKPLVSQQKELPGGFTLDSTSKEFPQGYVLDTPRKKELAAVAEKRGLIGRIIEGGNFALSLAALTPTEAITGLVSGESMSEILKQKDAMPGREAVYGAVDAAAAIGRSGLGMIASGYGAAAKTITSGVDAGEETRQQIMEAAAPFSQPLTEAGEQVLGGVGEFISPAVEPFMAMKEGLGDTALELTGSPAFATFADLVPDIALELLGLGATRKARMAYNQYRQAKRSGNIATSIAEAAPTTDTLFKVSGKMYDELAESGALLKADKFDDLVSKIDKATKKEGIHKRLTPKSAVIMDDMLDVLGSDKNINEIDVFRKQAQGAAKSLDAHDAMVGRVIKDEIDDFRADMKDDDFVTTGGLEPTEISTKYNIAQDLYGRAKKSELLQEAFEKARNQASGFENGIRTQFRAILNSKKKSRFFNEEELSAIKRVVRGDKTENIARLIGKLGFSEGSATHLIGTSIGVGAGAAVGGPAGAVAVPLIGQVSKKLAQKMTINNAEYADQVIRAGKDAKKITKAYLDNTAPKERNPAELSELLMRQDIKLENLPKSNLAQSAKDIATKARGIVGKLRSKLKKEKAVNENLRAKLKEMAFPVQKEIGVDDIELKQLRKDKEIATKKTRQEELDEKEVAALELTEQENIDIEATGLEYEVTLRNKIPIVRGEIKQMLDEIDEGGFGRQKGVLLEEGRTYDEQGTYKKMGTVRMPEWATDRGWTSKEISTALRKKLEGNKKLTDKQQEIFDVAYAEAEYRQEKIVKGGIMSRIPSKLKEERGSMSFKPSKKTDVFYGKAPVVGDVEIIKNPTVKHRQDISREYKKEWPKSTDPKTRTTYDTDGNQYIWRADKATHRDIEPIINKKFNTKTNQTEGFYDVEPVKSTTENLTETAKKYKTADEFVESRKKVFHQTSAETAKIIEDSGFKIMRGTSSQGDRMPIGVNTKTTDAIIALPKDKNIQVEGFFAPDAKIKEFNSRENVVDFLHNNSEEYTKKNFELAKIDKEYKKKSDDLMKWKKGMSDEVYEANLEESQKIIDEWGKEFNVVGNEAGEIANRVFKEQGVDAIFIKEDIGGVFGNKKTDNLVIFDESKLKTKSQLTDIWNKANKKR